MRERLRVTRVASAGLQAHERAAVLELCLAAYGEELSSQLTHAGPGERSRVRRGATRNLRSVVEP